MSSLTIVNNKDGIEIHSVRIDDGSVSVLNLADGSKLTANEMSELFPDFLNIIKSSENTEQLLSNLQLSNINYVWAHVSGKL